MVSHHRQWASTLLRLRPDTRHQGFRGLSRSKAEDRPMTTFNRFKLALDIQNAGNLRAIAREFVRVVDDAMAETQSTTATRDDAAVVLMVNKMESLCRSEDRFSAAYKLAQERSV